MCSVRKCQGNLNSVLNRHLRKQKKAESLLNMKTHSESKKLRGSGPVCKSLTGI